MRLLKLIVLLFIFYVLAYNFPLFFYSEKFVCKDKSVVINSDFKYDFNELCDYIENIREKTGFKENLKIFLTNYKIKYRLFSFFTSNLYHLNVITDNLVYAPVYIENKDINFKNFENISFKEKISEGIVFNHIIKEFGKIYYITLDKWKLIGYAKYIADEPQKYSIYDMCNSKDSDEEMENFRYMMLVKYFREYMKKDFKYIIVNNISKDYYINEMHKYYCR